MGWLADTRIGRGYLVVPAFAVLAAAVLLGCGKFYSSNQNTYLLHPIGPSYPSLASDWLLSTADAFPAFSAITRLTFRLAGEAGLVVLTIGLASIGFLAIAALSFVMLSDLEDQALRPWLVSAVVLTAGLIVPHVITSSSLRDFSNFQGLGGQYLLSFPGSVQPSDTGVLLLGSAALVVLAVRVPHVWLWLGAAGLAIVACVFHASYVAPLGVALVAMFVADMVSGVGLARLFGYLATGTGAVVALLLTNPVARSAGSVVGGAQEYLAFQRIPHHTLISEWPIWQTLGICILVPLAALLSKHFLHSWWLAVTMMVCLAISLVTAVAVQLTRSATIAMVFPWRISAIVVPVAFTIVFSYILSRVWLAWTRAAPKAQPALKVATTLGAVGAICLGVAGTSVALSRRDPPLYEALRATPPHGTGLIPLELMNLRLNARVPVFVDWKSHPYRPDELSEWVRRVELATAAEAKPETACGLVDRESLHWAVVKHDSVPNCLSSWSQRQFGLYTLLIRPNTHEQAR